MDHQTTLVDRRDSDTSAQALAQSLASIAQDMVAIAELQLRLLGVELGAWRRSVSRGLLIWAMACGLLVAALPTALIGIGFWLADAAQVPIAAGLLWVGFGAMLLVMGLFLAGWWQITKKQTGLQRSRNELRANLAAMRQVLSRYAGRTSQD